VIERYSRPEMAQLWSDENKFRTWLKVEILACEAMAEIGAIPKAAVDVIRAKADFDKDRVLEIEATVKHDVIAFLTNVAEYVGRESRFIHLGMTSSDLLDTSLASLMRQAGLKLLDGLLRLRDRLGERAKEFKHTPCIGRSHGIHAEPITFGLKLALWYDEVGRSVARLERAIETISTGKISGAVGTFAHVDPRVEEYVCRKLKLQPAPISTQIVQRDRHGEFLTTLALIASSLEKFATEIRNLQRTEILEVEESFTKGQKGSSAMPHKRNPVSCEQICGLARVVKANAAAALDNIALWHERDITHSSVERIIIPDSTIALDYMLDRFAKIVKNMIVYSENMLSNIRRTRGLVFSQSVLLTLTCKGVSRDDAYQIVQRCAMQAWESGGEFREGLLSEPALREHLSEQEVEACFDLQKNLSNIDYIFERVGLS